jgi:hypothetical protein
MLETNDSRRARLLYAWLLPALVRQKISAAVAGNLSIAQNTWRVSISNAAAMDAGRDSRVIKVAAS